jgi:hypothetical protein
MLLWLWDAFSPGQYRGVTDSETSARRAAEACITRGLATAARVESARFAMNAGLHASYQRTGNAWTARASGQRVRWSSVAAEHAS